jgi:hypothetical protein
MQQFIQIVLYAMWYTTPSLFSVRAFIFHARVVANRLLVIILSLVVDDVEEAELVDALGCGNDTEPVTELLLLEELLCTVCNCQNGVLPDARMCAVTYRYFK